MTIKEQYGLKFTKIRSQGYSMFYSCNANNLIEGSMCLAILLQSISDRESSGMLEEVENANISSDLFVNFSNFKKGGDFDLFMSSNYIYENSIACFPNLKKKIDDIIKYKYPKNYNLSNSDFF
jgi:hypothetical protein